MTPLIFHRDSTCRPLAIERRKGENEAVMTLQTCNVAFEDVNGQRHSLEVTAETLYEAVAQALAAFRRYEWIRPGLTRYDPDRHLPPRRKVARRGGRVFCI